LVVFTGAVGRVYSTPFFSGTTALDFGAGLEYRRDLSSGFTFSTVLATAGHRRTSVEELLWKWRVLSLEGTAGWLESKKLTNGRADLRWKHFGATASRQTYFDPRRQDAGSEGVATQAGRFDGYVSAFQSQLASGQALGGGVHFAWLQFRANQFWQKTGRTFTASSTEQITRRFSFAQFYTRGNGRSTVNVGGGFRSNLLAAQVEWQEYFTPGIGFQQLANVVLSFQLPHSTSLNLSLLGGRWTAYGGTYLNSGLMLSDNTTPIRRPKLIDYQGPQ
jgi:hypothetical protein